MSPRLLLSALAWIGLCASLPAMASHGYGQSGYGSSYGSGQVFRCESNDSRSRYCTVDTSGGVRLRRQISSSPCIEGRSWGWDRRGVWVDQGCRAEFEVGGNYYGRPGQGYPGQGVRRLRCQSDDYRYHLCGADDAYRGARIVRQLSQTPCVEGRNWGIDRRGIWVDQGCSAEFEIGGYGHGAPGYGEVPGYGRPGYGGVVRCESREYRYGFCRVGGDFRNVRLERQLSQAACQYNVSWGFRGDGIWVDRGCAAEFRVY